LRKLRRAKIAPPPDWLKEQVRAQKMFCVSRFVITVASEVIYPLALPSMFFLRPKKGHSVYVRKM